MSDQQESPNSARLDSDIAALERTIKARDRKEKMRPLGVAVTAAIVLVVIVGGIWIATNYSGKDETVDAAATASTTAADTDSLQTLTYTRSEALPETVTCTYTPDGSTAAREVSLPDTDNVPATGTTTVTLDTSQGKIGMELDRSVSPCTVNAIAHLAKEGYYNDTVCHRITTSGIYVLQCGDPSGTGSGGPGFQFANEYPTDDALYSDYTGTVTYARGTVAMANAGADTNGSQFFLNYEDSPLSPSYTYFGKITDEGLNTLDAIAAAGTADGSSDGAPAQEVRITTATVS